MYHALTYCFLSKETTCFAPSDPTTPKLVLPSLGSERRSVGGAAPRRRSNDGRRPLTGLLWRPGRRDVLVGALAVLLVAAHQRPLDAPLPVRRVQLLLHRQPGGAGRPRQRRALAARGGVALRGGRRLPVQAVHLQHAAQGQLPAALQDRQAHAEAPAGGPHQGGGQGQPVEAKVRGHRQPGASQVQRLRLLQQQCG